MKVCILSHCFYPSKKRGGPTVSITNMVKNLADKFELSVVTIIYDKDSDKPYDNVKEGKNRLFDTDVYYLSENNYEAFYSCLSEIKPDVIYVSSLFSRQYSVAALKYTKSNKDTRLIIAPRGELMPLALKRKSLIKHAFICFVKLLMNRNTEFHVTSDEEETALRKYFSGNRVWKIKNLPSKVSGGDKVFPKSAGSLSIVMVGRIHPIKNVHYAIELMSQLSGNVVLDIYGPEEDKKYVEQCKELADNMPDNIKINFNGIIDHEKVSDVMKNHHIFLSPTESENYGHSIIESLLCGVPTVISNNTPWHNLEENNAGYDIDLGDKAAFVKALQSFVDMDEGAYLVRKECARKYIESGLEVKETVDKYIEMLLKK